MYKVTGSLQEKNGIAYTVLNIIIEVGAIKEKKQSWKTTKLPVKNNRRKLDGILRQRISDMEIEAQQREEILRQLLNSEDSENERPDEVSVISREEQFQQMLFSDFMRYWLNGIKNSIQATTFGSYDYIVSKRICPYFDKLGVRLCDLSALHLKDYYDSIVENGATWNSVMKHHANIHKALKFAVKTDILSSNPADKVELAKRKKYVADFYNEDELKQLLDVVLYSPIVVPVYLACFYGLRRSEALGLKWDAIDFKAKTICIRHTVCKAVVDGKLTILPKDTTKNASSYRTLPLVPQIEALLRTVQEKQKRNRLIAGKSYNTEYLEYICVNDLGDLLKPDYVTNNLKRLLKKKGMRVIRFHDLRHSCASLLLANHVPLKDIQVWLGHSDFSTTANIYSHLEFGSKISSANMIGQCLGGETSEVNVNSEIVTGLMVNGLVDAVAVSRA